jgi:hypothetical protein
VREKMRRKLSKPSPPPPISPTIRVLWDPPKHPKLGTQILKKKFKDSITPTTPQNQKYHKSL